MAGTNPALIVRIAANLEELKRNLADGTSTINTTTAAMGKLSASFMGEKLIQNAQNVVAAVNSIGGAAKLTDAEQARVNTTLEKALEKYRLLGREAPQAMVALAHATKQVEEPTGGVSTKMIALGSAIGTMAANALAALGRLALDGLKALGTGIADLVMSASKVSGIDNSFRTLAASINESGNAMLGAMRQGTRGLVTDLDLMTAANKAILLGLPVTAKEMGDLSQTATVLGKAMGLGPTQAFDDLITALGRSSPMILDNLGLSVKVGEANEVYAAKLHTTAEKLTDAEKKQAFYNAAMDAARAKVAALGEQHLTLGDNIERASIWWSNFKNDLSIAIARSPALTAAMETLGEAFAGTFAGANSTRVQTMIGLINKFAIWIVDAGLALVKMGHTGAEAIGVLQVPVKAVSAAVTYLIERFAAGIASMAELAAKMPGVGGAFEGTARAARAAADTWAAARKESGEGLTAALDMAKGQGVVHGALDRVAGVLTTMRAKMVEASASTKELTEKTSEQLAALRAAAAAHAANEAAIEKAAAAQRALLADMATFEKHIKVLEPGVALFQNMTHKLEPLVVETKAWASGLHFAAETIEDEVVPALAKTEAHIAKVSLTWSQAMDLVRQGEGSMTGTLPGNRDSSLAHRMETQRAWDEHRYWGPVLNGSPSNPRGTGPDWEAIGFPARALGGPVAANRPYMVGERGPELFVPQASGNVLANGVGGGFSLTVENHFHANVFSDDDELASRMSRAVINRLRAEGVRLPTSA